MGADLLLYIYGSKELESYHKAMDSIWIMTERLWYTQLDHWNVALNRGNVGASKCQKSKSKDV